MPRVELTLGNDRAALERLVRILDASVALAALHALAEERKSARDEGWVFLSDLAKRLDQAPGTVSAAVQKMVPTLLEEKYERGRRFFRARVTSVKLVLDGPGFAGV